MKATAGRWTALALLLMMWSVAASLTGIAQGLAGGGSTLLVSLAVGIAWLLAGSQLPGWQAGGLAGWIGLGLITLQVGRLGDEFVHLAANLGQWVLRLMSSSPASAAPAVAALLDLLSGYRVLASRSWNWLAAFIAGRSAIDPVASALAWSTLLWLAACWAGWWTWRRRQPLVAAAPPLALLGTTLYLSRSSHIYLLLPLGATLLLLALSGHQARQQRWEQQHTAQPEAMLGPVALAAFPVSVALVLAAALTPSLSTDRLLELGRQVGGRPVAADGGLSESLGLSRASRPGTGFDPVLIAGLPNRRLIGSGPELSEQVVMTITLTDVPVGSPAPRFYWRALSYDRYTGHGWQTSSLAIQAFDPGQAAVGDIPTSMQVVRQRVQAVGELGGLVYSAGELASVDQPYDLAWRDLGRDPFAATVAGDAYWAESLEPRVTQAKLRAAGTDYPDWVLQRYLDLPADLPDRVRALAANLTATAPTPYDRAVALEQYLRAFPYTLDVPTPPGDSDVVDYFLFDLQQGYCDYYASAMVVLARAAGLPARLVVGYFTGTAQPTEGTMRYVVTEADAHSWPELYFPGLGWLEFEPTSGRPAIDRTAQAGSETGGEAEPPRLSLADELRAERWAALRTAGVRATGFAVLAGLVAAGWLVLRDTLRLRRMSPAQAIAALYGRLFVAVDRLAPGLAPGSTPYELLAAYVARSATLGAAGRVLTAGSQYAHQLIEAHLTATFRAHSGEITDLGQATRAWHRLGPRLWLARRISLAGALVSQLAAVPQSTEPPPIAETSAVET